MDARSSGHGICSGRGWDCMFIAYQSPCSGWHFGPNDAGCRTWRRIPFRNLARRKRFPSGLERSFVFTKTRRRQNLCRRRRQRSRWSGGRCIRLCERLGQSDRRSAGGRQQPERVTSCDLIHSIWCDLNRNIEKWVGRHFVAEVRSQFYLPWAIGFTAAFRPSSL